MDKGIVTTEQYSKEKIELIKRTVAQGATNDELVMFLYQARRTGLDPLARQIYFIKDKGGRAMIQTSIDGFRVVAERSRNYAGQDAPEFEEKDNQVVKATVTVYRWHGDQRYAAGVGVAYMAENGKQTPVWKQMPHLMLAKVAESLALRKAFPQDLSGLYTAEETGNDAPPEKPEPPKPSEPTAQPTIPATTAPRAQATGPTPPKASDRQIEFIHDLCKQKGESAKDMAGWNTLQAKTEIERLLALPSQQK